MINFMITLIICIFLLKSCLLPIIDPYCEKKDVGMVECYKKITKETKEVVNE